MKDKMNMKRITLIMAALAILVTGCSKGQKFTLIGDMETSLFDAATDSLILQSDGLPSLYTIPVVDKAFSYSGTVEKPSLATLKAPGERGVVSKLLVLEKGTITFERGYPRGTPLNEAFYELDQKVKEIRKENRGNPQAGSEAVFKLYQDFLDKHANDPSAIVALVAGRRYMSPEQMSELIAMTPKSIQRDSHIDKLLKEIRLMDTMRQAAELQQQQGE